MMKKIGIILLAILIVGYFGFNMAAKSAIETLGTKAVGSKVSLSTIRISPFSGSVTLRGLEVASPEGFEADKMISLGEIAVNMDVGSIFSDTITIQEINIVAPEITYEMTLKGSNINALKKNIANNNTKPEPEAEKASGTGQQTGDGSKKVVIDDLYIRQAKLRVMTPATGESSVETLDDIHMKDIGKGGTGTSALKATTRVVQAVIEEILTIDPKSITGGVKNIKENLDSVSDSLKELF